MIKHFCDECGTEINRSNQFEHKEFKIGKHIVELTIKTPQITEDALCLYCVLDEVYKIDDRPSQQ